MTFDKERLVEIEGLSVVDGDKGIPVRSLSSGSPIPGAAVSAATSPATSGATPVRSLARLAICTTAESADDTTRL